MTTTKTADGGPAFPEYVAEKSIQGMQFGMINGMSLRDYFAAKAMQGYSGRGGEDRVFDTHEDVAHWAYAVADAMIAEREK